MSQGDQGVAETPIVSKGLIHIFTFAILSHSVHRASIVYK